MITDELSNREIEVIKEIGKGLNATEIGVNLSITASTVRTHKKHIFEKLQAKNSAQAIWIYLISKQEPAD